MAAFIIPEDGAFCTAGFTVAHKQTFAICFFIAWMILQQARLDIGYQFEACISKDLRHAFGIRNLVVVPVKYIAFRAD